MTTAVIPSEGLGKSYASAAGESALTGFSGRIPQMDGLRGIAIGAVVVCHYFQFVKLTQHGSVLSYLQAVLRFGWTGVDLFFVLSGFLIGGILMDARTSQNYFRVFYVRRFFRIVPIYTVILVLFWALTSAALRTNHSELTWLKVGPLPWFSFWTFTQNLWMAQLGFFGASAIIITWSLCVEEQFYLTLPFVVRFLSMYWLTRFVLVGICASPLLRIAIHAFWPENWMAAYVLMPCRSDALLLGVLAAVLLRNPAWRGRIQRAKFAWAFAFPVILLGFLYLMDKAPYPDSPRELTFGYTWMGLSYFCLLLYALTRPKSLVSRSLTMSWLRWLGSIAYGVYLIHELVLGAFFGFIWNREPGITDGYTLLVTLAALALTLLIAWLSFRYFESPLIRMGHRSSYEFTAYRADELPTAASEIAHP